jgi:hypothetical protein
LSDAEERAAEADAVSGTSEAPEKALADEQAAALEENAVAATDSKADAAAAMDDSVGPAAANDASPESASTVGDAMPIEKAGIESAAGASAEDIGAMPAPADTEHVDAGEEETATVKETAAAGNEPGSEAGAAEDADARDADAEDADAEDEEFPAPVEVPVGDEEAAGQGSPPPSPPDEDTRRAELAANVADAERMLEAARLAQQAVFPVDDTYQSDPDAPFEPGDLAMATMSPIKPAEASAVAPVPAEKVHPLQPQQPHQAPRAQQEAKVPAQPKRTERKRAVRPPTMRFTPGGHIAAIRDFMCASKNAAKLKTSASGGSLAPSSNRDWAKLVRDQLEQLDDRDTYASASQALHGMAAAATAEQLPLFVQLLRRATASNSLRRVDSRCAVARLHSVLAMAQPAAAGNCLNGIVNGLCERLFDVEEPVRLAVADAMGVLSLLVAPLCPDGDTARANVPLTTMGERGFRLMVVPLFQKLSAQSVTAQQGAGTSFANACRLRIAHIPYLWDSFGNGASVAECRDFGIPYVWLAFDCLASLQL